MTLEEAVALAAEIHGDERFRLIAIGRFVTVAELVVDDPERPLPWGVSLVAGDELGSPARLWSRADWETFRRARDRRGPSTPPAPKASVQPAPPERRDARCRQQMSLFD